jgi:hypothetical protein
MIDPQAKPKLYFRLMVVVALMGVVSAVVTFAFMALVHLGTDLVWEQTAQLLGIDSRLFTLLVCTLGGLLVGLLVKIFGDHSGIFAEVMREFGKTGRFDYRNAPGILITALVSLISGASLGPESPLRTFPGDRLSLQQRRRTSASHRSRGGRVHRYQRFTRHASSLCKQPAAKEAGSGLRRICFRESAVFVFLSGRFQPAGPPSKGVLR